MVEIYDDRVEITNPGGLVNSIPRDQFGKRSLSRNPLLFGLFARMKMVEQVGSGIVRIQTAMTEAGLPEPIFSFEGMFSVTLKRPPNFNLWLDHIRSHIGPTRVRIIELIYSNPAISKNAMATAISISTTAIDKHITALRGAGLIERIGSDRNGQWKLFFNFISQPRLVENTPKNTT